MTTVAEELPFAAVVADEHLDKTCSSCFAPLDNVSRCIGCKVVHYCDNACQNKDWVDHKRECSFLKNVAPNVPPAICRLIARITMKLKRPDGKKPAFNGRVFEDLMDHRDKIQNDPVRTKTFSSCKRIFPEYMGDKAPGSDLLMTIFGKINAFSIMDGINKCGQALYLGLSVHDHSCVPDSNVIFDGCKVSLRAKDRDMKYSKNLTITYTDRLYSNRDRQQKLQTQYYFTCKCARCSDPNHDFLCESARSECCPDSYCLLDPAAKELTCNKCGTISGITVEEAVAANKEVREFSEGVGIQVVLAINQTLGLKALDEAWDKFSKILSPLNLNMLQLIEKIVNTAASLEFGSALSTEYARELLPSYKHYLTIGDQDYTTLIWFIADSMSLHRPPTKKTLHHLELALAVYLISHGPEHSKVLTCGRTIAEYQVRLQHYTRHGIDLLDG